MTGPDDALTPEEAKVIADAGYDPTAILAFLFGEPYDDALTVCIAHGAFIPCRKDGEHRYTDSPYWVKSVRDYQTSPIEGLTWEPAWTNG